MTIATNGLSLESNLAVYFTFKHDDPDIRRLCYFHSLAASGLDTNSNPKPPKIPRIPRGSKPTAAASNTSLVTNATGATTRSDSSRKALAAWYAELVTSVPALAGVALPCLHWLSNITPCLKSAVCLKQYQKKPHVISPVVKTNMQAILVWLKSDPLGRF